MAGSRYIADPVDDLIEVELDGLTALFHRPSGMTHIVAPPAPQILHLLSSAPSDPQELLLRLAETFDVEGGEDVLSARLRELTEAGLVRPA